MAAPTPPRELLARARATEQYNAAVRELTDAMDWLATEPHSDSAARRAHDLAIGAAEKIGQGNQQVFRLLAIALASREEIA